MYPRASEPIRRHRNRDRRRHDRLRPTDATRDRYGFTLSQIVISIAITSMLTVVLGGLLAAVQTARQHTQGLQDATMTSQAAVGRMRLMFGQAAVYQVDTRPSRLGVAVVHQTWNRQSVPSFLVLWTGGIDGGLAEQGLLPRLPLAEELLIYGPDPENPAHLVEMRLPDVSTTVDFDDANFNRQMLSLLHSPSVRKLLLCDHLQVARSQNGKDVTGNARFEFRESPSSYELNSADPGEAGWNDLRWAQGIVGLRQADLDMEILIETQNTPDQAVAGDAIPFFDSASRRYVSGF